MSGGILHPPQDKEKTHTDIPNFYLLNQVCCFTMFLVIIVFFKSHFFSFFHLLFCYFLIFCTYFLFFYLFFFFLFFFFFFIICPHSFLSQQNGKPTTKTTIHDKARECVWQHTNKVLETVKEKGKWED